MGRCVWFSGNIEHCLPFFHFNYLWFISFFFLVMTFSKDDFKMCLLCYHIAHIGRPQEIFLETNHVTTLCYIIQVALQRLLLLWVFIGNSLWCGGQCMYLVVSTGHKLFFGNGVLRRVRPLQTSLLLGHVCYTEHQSVSTDGGGPQGVLHFPHMNIGSFLAEFVWLASTILCPFLGPQYKKDNNKLVCF